MVFTISWTDHQTMLSYVVMSYSDGYGSADIYVKQEVNATYVNTIVLGPTFFLTFYCS